MLAIECGCLRHCSSAGMEMSGTLLGGMFEARVPFHSLCEMQNIIYRLCMVIVL